jgi:hypothetical protein
LQLYVFTNLATIGLNFMTEHEFRLSESDREEIRQAVLDQETRMHAEIDRIIDETLESLDRSLSHVAWKVYDDLPYNRSKIVNRMIRRLSVGHSNESKK